MRDLLSLDQLVGVERIERALYNAVHMFSSKL